MINKPVIGILAVLLAAGGVLFGQDTSAKLESYTKNFDKSDINTKLLLLEDASKQNEAGLVPLFDYALNYVVGVSSRSQNVSLLRQICLLSIEQVKTFSYTDSRRLLWKLFIKDNDSNIRNQVLKALAVIGKEDKELVGYINKWLEEQNTIYKTGKEISRTIIAQCVTTLGALDTDTSFPVVFNTMVTGYSNDISAICKNVLINLNGDFKQLLIDKIKGGSIPERRLALDVSLVSKKLNDTEKGDIAEVALDVALKLGSVRSDEIGEIGIMRNTACNALSERKRASATKLIIHYFELVIVDFNKGTTNRTVLIDCIKALGNMGNNEAAKRLSFYLADLNTYTEKKKVYDEIIVYEVVSALGKIGDKVAFDYLMRVKFLNYNQRVKASADEAIKNLKW